MNQTDDVASRGETLIKPCLWFDGQALEAAEFYAATFPRSTIDQIVRSPSDYPAGKAGDVSWSSSRCWAPVHGLNGGANFHFTEAVSFQVYTDDQEETDRYWDASPPTAARPASAAGARTGSACPGRSSRAP